MILVVTESMYNYDLVEKLAWDLGLNCDGLTLYLRSEWLTVVSDGVIVIPSNKRFSEIREKARKLSYLEEIKETMKLKKRGSQIEIVTHTLH